jgi:leader peptidase (prepilin peptidase)/N-methyltransferase
VPAIAAFPAGLLLGSFVTVLAYRVPRHESFVTGRSRCPGCGAQIAAYDNIPVVSWLLLQGRCRSCGDRISARYPLAELSLGLLYLGTVLVLGTGDAGKLALGLVLCTLLVAVTLTDLERRIIPNALVIAGVIVAIPLLAIADPGALPSHLIAAAVAGGLLFLIALAYPRGMGMGDVKLVMMMGLYLGRSVAPALLVAFAAGALVGLAMIARHGSDARKSAIPFGPFLAFGGVVGLWFGDAMASWYLDTFTGG